MCGVVALTLLKEEVAGVAWLPMERRMRLREAALVDMDWMSLAKRERIDIQEEQWKGRSGVDRQELSASIHHQGQERASTFGCPSPKTDSRTVAGGSRRCMSGP